MRVNASPKASTETSRSSDRLDIEGILEHLLKAQNINCRSNWAYQNNQAHDITEETLQR